MEFRELGRSGIEIAPLVFGGNVFGWTIDEETSFKLLDAFTDAGFNAIDTADVYSSWAAGNHGGESETTIGKWLRNSKKRDKVVLATKVGMEVAGHKGLSKFNIKRAVEDSLRRLNTDYVDLYQAHVDDETVPLEETLEAFAELIEEGKVRAIGCSNYSAKRLSMALSSSRKNNWPHYETLQPLYNLLDRKVYEDELEGVCREHAIGVISYSSLASGFLSGKYKVRTDLAQSARGYRVEKYMNPRGARIIAAVETVGKRLGASNSSVALAWLMARPSVTAPIASATSLTQLSELIAAAELKLDADTVNYLEKESQED